MRSHRLPWPERITLILMLAFLTIFSPFILMCLAQADPPASEVILQTVGTTLRIFVPVWIVLRLGSLILFGVRRSV